MADHYRQLLELEDRLGIDSAYTVLRDRAAAQNKDDEDIRGLRYAWRALRDPWYRGVYEHFGPSALTSAGFFDDGDDIESMGTLGTAGEPLQPLEPALLTTPVDKLLGNAAEQASGAVSTPSARPAVLLTTGGFAPVHNGHLRMMETAKAAVEDNGQPVIGGYISPGHDQYVQTKSGKIAAISERIHFCQQVCHQSDWLYTDPWEGRYTDRAVNFTDVIVHLQVYLEQHLPMAVDVWYVFGADNAEFARAFIERGQAVCVSRKDVSIDPQLQADMVSADNRVLFAAYDGDELWANSAAIRYGDTDHLPQRQTVKETETTIRPYALRDDLDWACAAWQRSGRQLPLQDFTTALSRYIKDCLGDQISEVILFRPQDQEQILDGLDAEVINCDPATKIGQHLQVCRQFVIADGQIHADQLRNRPGYPSLDDQLSELPVGEYILVDDDIASGYTMQALRELMPAQVRIIEQLSLLAQTIPEPVFDVCDCKDFLLGASGGGLVVQLPDGQDARIPYMLPYTSLLTRAKLPVADELKHSLFLWQLNLNFHAQSGLTVGDAAPDCRTLLTYLGFGSEQLLADVCRRHLEALERSG